MRTTTSLTLVLGHDLSKTSLINFARTSQATSISDDLSVSVIIKLLMLFFLNLDQSVFRV